MKYINKNLTIEKIKVKDIAKKFGTPIYCYSLVGKKKTPNTKLKKIIFLYLGSNEIY